MGGVFPYMKPQPETNFYATPASETVSDADARTFIVDGRPLTVPARREPLGTWATWRQRNLLQALPYSDHPREGYHAPGLEDSFSFGLCCLYCGLAWRHHPDDLRVKWDKTRTPVLEELVT